MSSVPPTTPPDDVPDEDWAEQQTEADPFREAEEVAARSLLAVSRAEADEADVLEQEAEVFDDEEL